MSKAPLAVVAMSGGVDSSVAAALLLRRGFRVIGASLRMWEAPDPEDPKVCSNARDAAGVARFLGIDHVVLDRRSEFAQRVLDPFALACAAARTPNPCVACNADFKLGGLLDWAKAKGAAFVATGHYARLVVEDGFVRLFRGRDRSRDQSYFLFQLRQAQLERACFPLGDLSKVEVRAEARRLGLPVADKPESQDLCLGRPADFVVSRGFGGRAGDVVDQEGRVLGRHGGIERFTIGQRRGLGLASRAPLYVQSLDGSSGRVIVGETPPVARRFHARGWSWIAQPASGERLGFQVRYRHEAIPGILEPSGDGIRVVLEKPALAVTPGQAVVAYRGDEVVGGGWIDRTLLREE